MGVGDDDEGGVTMLIAGGSVMLKLGIIGAEEKPGSAKSGSSGRTMVGTVGVSSSSGKQIVGLGIFGPSLTLILGTANRGELVKGLGGAILGEFAKGLADAVLGESTALLLLTGGPEETAICTSSSTFSLGLC